ncbi:MAG: hypothetical protein AVO34_08540 [Firmicutes bacterium ML8_F2]|jgi:hypothetical protein|nr:MAG: hypothetical protein AVO34_08540 [Firmicutes bacterium ML8_F2]
MIHECQVLNCNLCIKHSKKVRKRENQAIENAVKEMPVERITNLIDRIENDLSINNSKNAIVKSVSDWLS